MHIVERRIYAGCTLEIQRYLTETVRAGSGSGPNPRFKNPEDRKEFMLARSRRKFERLVNQNFTPAGFYCTFTFDEENECHTVEETNYLRGLFTRRLRRKYPDAKIVSVIGKGKKTHRYHAHMLIEGIPEDFVRSQWTYGDVVRVDHLREHNYYDGVDHGRDYTALADYMLNHWTPEQGQRKWKGTRNLKQPEIEVIKESAGEAVKRSFHDSKVPDTPEGYMFVDAKETKYGFNCFKFVLDPKKKRQRKLKGRKEDKRRQRKKTETRQRK